MTQTTTAVYPGAGTTDEAIDADGEVRPAYVELLDEVTRRVPERLAARVAGHVEAAGARFGGEDGWPFHVDPVPRLLAREEWEQLTRGLVQRTAALEAFVADVHGPRRALAAGAVPEHVVSGSPFLEPDLLDGAVPLPPRIAVAGIDVVRDADGRLRVLEDNCRTPSGIAFALAAREAIAAHVGVPDEVADLREATRRALPEALESLRPPGEDDGAIVLLTDGPSNTAHFEHRVLAELAGLPLVEPGDLVARDDRLLLREDGRPIAVLYRRTDVDRLRDGEGRPTAIGELVLPALRAGTLAVANGFGCGVADDKATYPHVDALIRFFLDEEPLLPAVPTLHLADPAALEEALERLDQLVLKPRDGLGGHGVVLGPEADAEELRDVRALILEDPAAWLAQEPVSLSTHPTVVDGRLAPRHVDLRPFVLRRRDGGRAVLPGGLTRVALAAGERVVNSSRGGGGKDTWVVAR